MNDISKGSLSLEPRAICLGNQIKLNWYLFGYFFDPLIIWENIRVGLIPDKTCTAPWAIALLVKTQLGLMTETSDCIWERVLGKLHWTKSSQFSLKFLGSSCSIWNDVNGNLDMIEATESRCYVMCRAGSQDSLFLRHLRRGCSAIFVFWGLL